VSEKPPNPIP